MSKNIHKHKTLREIHEDVPADHYDRGIEQNIFQKYWHTKRFKKVLENIDFMADRMLDVGCHSGLFTQKIAQAVNPNKIYGIDVSASAIEVAKKRIKNGNFKIANAHKLPFKGSQFDCVFCLEVLEHVEEPRQVLSEIRRVLKKGGHGFILVPTDNLLFRVIWWIWNNLNPVWKHAHVQSFKANSLEQLLVEAKFRILKVTYFNFSMLKIVKFIKP